MAQVETVRGRMDVDRLGPTSMHEHVIILDPEARDNWPHGLGADENALAARAVEDLSRLRAAGIETIVDPTGYGLGRNIPRLQRINASVDLNIVVATGLYRFLELPTFLRYRDDDWIVELLVGELREGIGDTGVKAAFLKCAVESYGLVGDVPRMLGIVAKAAIETGSPVMVHTNAAHRTGLIALEALTAAGVAPDRIVIAHAGDSNDLEYLRRIADTGAILGCDRFGLEHFNPDADRIRTLATLAAEGYTDRVHLGQDSSAWLDFLPDTHPGYCHLPQTILPALLAAGVTQAQIDEMLVENPRRFFR